MRILIDNVSTNNKIILQDLVTFFYLAKTSRAEAKSSLRKIGASMAFAPDDHHPDQDDQDGSNQNNEDSDFDEYGNILLILPRDTKITKTQR